MQVVQPVGNSSTGGDAASLNALLASAGRFRGVAGKTYYLEAPLVIRSNTELDMTGCSVQSVGGRDFHLIHNYAYTSPAATAADGAISSGSNVLTTSLGASAVVGQTVTVAGASTGGYQAICGYVSAATSTTITLVDALGAPVNAGTTVSSAAVSLYNRDSNITVRGGLWNKNGTGGQGLTIGNHALLFRHVDNLRVLGTQHTSNCGKYSMSLASVTNYVIEKIVFQSSFSDGVHIDGPAFGGVVRDISGACGDDMVAITPMDWHQYGDVCGDVSDLLVENIYPLNTTRAAVKVLSGAQGAARRITVRNVRGSSVSTAGPIWIGDDYTQPETGGGYIDGIHIERVSLVTANNIATFLLNGRNMGRIVIDGLTVDNANATTSPILVAPSATATIDALILSNIYVKNTGANQYLLNINGFTTIAKLKALNWHSMATQAYAPIAVNGGAVTELTVDGFDGVFSPMANAAIVYLVGATAAVQRARLSNVDVTGSGGGTALVGANNVSGQTLVDVALVNCWVTGYAWLLALATTTNVKMSGVTTVGMSGLMFVWATGNLTVSGAGNNTPVGANNWNVTAGGKIAVQVVDGPPSTHAGAIPTVAAGAGAGTSPTITVAGTDRAGTITVTTGTTPAAGSLATVTFMGTWPQAPKVQIEPTSSAAAALQPYVASKTTTTFVLGCVGTPAGATTYTFDYLVAA